MLTHSPLSFLFHQNEQGAEAGGEEGRKGHYVGVHASGFKDFLLKAELLRALVDCGFEHPSEGERRGTGEREGMEGERLPRGRP